MEKVLTIAGFDPSGGAGVTRDLETFRELGVRGLGVVSSIASQTSGKVLDVEILESPVVKKELSAVFEESEPDAVRKAKNYVTDKIRCSEEVDERVSRFTDSQGQVEVSEAIRELIQMPDAYTLAPEVGINRAYAKDGAKS